MISNIQKWKMTLINSFSLLAVFVIFLLLNFWFAKLGAYISQFNGQVTIESLTLTAKSTAWNQSQVLWIYLFPYLIFLIGYILLNWNPYRSFEKPKWLMYLRAWFYTLMIIMVFFIPIYDIIMQQGIYHALNWLHISINIQYTLGILMLLLFCYRAFSVAAIFSHSLILPLSKLTINAKIFQQLIYIWIIPYAVLVISVYFVSNTIISGSNIYFLSALLVLLIINSKLMLRYDVIS